MLQAGDGWEAEIEAGDEVWPVTSPEVTSLEFQLVELRFPRDLCAGNVGRLLR
jgi:hypothetical protein